MMMHRFKNWGLVLVVGLLIAGLVVAPLAIAAVSAVPSAGAAIAERPVWPTPIPFPPPDDGGGTMDDFAWGG
jgi:hypothetical protein